ncbi:arrestin domain-containing protein 3-like protein [Aphelenchoides avenae]|nr:arrestin domain-containing protein 3-like protein [Aphelenchus avenae]
MDTFEVRLRSSGGVYAPGDTVEGVVLVPEKQLSKASCVRLRATGVANVEWTDTKLESRTGFTPASVQSVVYKAEEKCTHGSIRYFCESTIERKGGLFKSDKKVSVGFIVRPTYDLNVHLNLRRAEQTEISEEKASAKGHVSASVTIPRGGFVPGEHIPLSVVVSNSSKHNVARVELTLTERVTFVAFSNARARLDPHGHFTGRRTKEASTTLATVHQPLWVPSKSVGEHQVSIVIPECNKSFKTAYVKLRHHVEVALVTSTEKRIVGEVPIVIGSVPLNPATSTEDQPPAYTEKDAAIASAAF